ncbi:MAG: tRNA (guanosine(37)-N1)-methyltransferase TrmD, partial [Alphaproteobacteria bacterium]|nr:tRNA (guanosine(37)-N1)-methyltransferase TrmD [Alphaproteobacteria bacterium]
MTFHAIALTLFPEMFPGFLGHSIAGKALLEGKWSIDTIQIRDFGISKHKNVDDTSYGGGPGMVMRADVLDGALQRAHAMAPNNKMIYLSPRGTPFTQEISKEFAALPGLTMLCGRFEAIDERIIEKWGLAEISIGDYILSGGEVAALTVLDSVVRILPSVMGNAESDDFESFSKGLLEYPHYTRPHSWENKIVPDILLSGDHTKIATWRQEQAERITKERRPDL